MKYQTNPELGPFINHWGCNFCSILSKVEKRSGWAFKWSNEAIVEVYTGAIDRGFLQKEVFDKAGKPKDGCDIYDYSGLFNYCAEYAGVTARSTGWRHEEHDYHPVANEEEILELKRDGYAGSHFVGGTGMVDVGAWQNEIEFDPIEGGSNCAKTGWIASKRILVF